MKAAAETFLGLAGFASFIPFFIMGCQWAMGGH